MVWPRKGHWYCSSCHEGGDAADWVASVEGFDRKKAEEILLERFGAPPDQCQAGARDQSQATTLVTLAQERAEFFHSPQGDAYATLAAEGHQETWVLKSRTFRRWLAAQFYARQKTVPNSQALQDAVTVLEGHALFAGPEHEVHVRVAEAEGAIYLDVADRDWQAVEVTAKGWRVVPAPPVKFRRARGMLPLPLYGEQGTAKSTNARVLKAMVDPSTSPLRSEPKEPRDLMIAANNSWIVAYDNLSHLPTWLSDAICRLATGGGFATRELYTDSEEALFESQRPALLTSIEEVIIRGDLLDRSLVVYLPQIKEGRRQTEARFWTEFEAARPRIFGALLGAVAGAMRHQDEVHISNLPRMADFALWAVAAERALGWQRGTFLRAYVGNRKDANSLALEASPVVPVLLASLEDTGGTWDGSAADLLTRLNGLADEKTVRQRGWPKTAQHLSGNLRRLAPSLRASGIDVQFHQTPGAGSKKLLSIKTSGEESDASDADLTSATHFDSGATQPGDAPTPVRDCGLGREGDGESQRGGAGSVISERMADPPRNVPLDQVLAGTSLALLPGEMGVDAVAKRVAPDPPGVGGVAGVAECRPSVCAPGVTQDRHTYEVLATTAAVESALPALLGQPALGLDLETTGLDPRADCVRLVQLATSERVYVLDAFRVDPRVLAPVLAADNVKVLHNAKFDLQFLLALGLPVSPVWDTMLADQLVRASRVPRGLGDLAEELLGIHLDKSLQKSAWEGDLVEAQLAYAARDAAVLLPLRERLETAAGDACLARCLNLENRAVPALAWLEHSGAPFDTEAWRGLADGALGEKLQAEDALNQMIGEALEESTLFGPSVNWNAPQQVLRVLQGLGIEASDTREETLLELKEVHPLLARLLAYREVGKRVGTYGLGVLGDVHPLTGRIHADWRQIGAESGRMSCTRPNLQNIPRTPAYRACFKPLEGRVLVKADYSQVELRIAAEIAGDERMRQAYRDHEDLHTVTARLVLGKNEVTKADRQAAKALNFGLLYGMGAPSLAAYAAQHYGVQLSAGEAERFRDRFFATYPGLRTWHRSQPQGQVNVRTLCGRLRRRVERYTEKLNTPVQGTGADGLKGALALLWEGRERFPSAYPVLAVHDEIVVECDRQDAEEVREWLADCMRRAMGAFLRHVPVEVEAAVGEDWSAAG